MSMKTIHKHELLMDAEPQTFALPEGAKILEFCFIRNSKTLFFWAEVNTDINTETLDRTFRVFKSGDGIPEAYHYVASTIDQYVPESYHLYELSR